MVADLLLGLWEYNRAYYKKNRVRLLKQVRDRRIKNLEQFKAKDNLSKGAKVLNFTRKR